jgi:uncharacterized damage-inducible protein DinB
MSLQKLATNYTAFNLWANTRIAQWLQPVDVAVLTQHTPSSFASIDGTLQHIVQTQKFWQLFILEKDISTMRWATYKDDPQKTLQDLLTTSAEMKHHFSQFSEDDLLKTLHLNMSWAKNKCSRYEYIQHIVNHGTFHRGQIVTMARCLGIVDNIPNTDYNIFNTVG